jgi:hypothetical protein
LRFCCTELIRICSAGSNIADLNNFAALLIQGTFLSRERSRKQFVVTSVGRELVDTSSDLNSRKRKLETRTFVKVLEE